MFDDPLPHDPASPEGVLGDEDLVRSLCEQAGHVAVGECRLVTLIGEMDRRRLWEHDGARSCAHWLNWRCGTSIGTAREQARVGRALLGLPLVRAAFGAGRLSYSKVRALTRIATPDLEATLVEWAEAATAAQLERIVAEYRRADPAEGTRALGVHRRRYLRTFTDADGMVVVRARLAPDDGAVVLAALEAARTTLSAEAPVDLSAESSSVENRVDEPPLPDAADVSAADALVALCRSGLSSEPASEPPVRVVVHVDEAVLADSAAEGCSFIAGAGAVAAHTAQRLACDAPVSRLVRRPDGSVEPRGRTRSVPPAMRRALLTRDRTCRWPGCSFRRFLHAHHVRLWSRGGETALSNLATLCTAHHRLVHEGGWNLEMAPSGSLTVRSPDGRILPTEPSPAPRGPGLAAQHTSAGLTIGPETIAYGGERFDLAMAIDALLCLSGAMWEEEKGKEKDQSPGGDPGS